MSRWIQREPAPNARARVICVSRAGGSAQDFDQWRAPLGRQVELCAVQPPGRLDRFREPAVDDLHVIAAEVASAIGELENKPFLVFGDCMGALIAYETVRALRGRGARLPSALVLSSYPAPDRLRTERPYHDKPAEVFRQRLRDVGGVPPSALEDDEFFELLLPTLRADFAAFERYRYRPQPPLDIDIHAIVGQDDPYVPASVLQGWKQQTTGEFALSTFAGGHFFLRESDEVVNFVRDLAFAAGSAPRT